MNSSNPRTASVATETQAAADVGTYLFISFWVILILAIILVSYFNGQKEAATECRRIQERDEEMTLYLQLNESRKRSLSAKDARTINPLKEKRQRETQDEDNNEVQVAMDDYDD